MESINWNAKRHVYVSKEYSEAYVKSSGGYVEFDDYRLLGGRVLDSLPPDAVFVGTFTNAEISNMRYPE